MRPWFRKAAWIVVSGAVGAAVGFALTERQGATHGFLRSAKPVALAGAPRASYDGILSRRAYVVAGDFESVVQGIRAEIPGAVEQTRDAGSRGRLFVIPRVENGRTRYALPPAETVAVVPMPDGSGVVVEVSAYTPPNVLEGILVRLRRSLRI